MPSVSLQERIDNDFVFHPSNPSVNEKFASIRRTLHSEAIFLSDICPEGRELSLALTHLEEAMFWANAAIARTQPREEEVLPEPQPQTTAYISD